MRNPNPYPQTDQSEAVSGFSGSTSPASVANATTPKRGTANDNPFTAMLDHVATINNAFSMPQSGGGPGGGTPGGGIGPATSAPSAPTFNPNTGTWMWPQGANIGRNPIPGAPTGTIAPPNPSAPGVPGATPPVTSHDDWQQSDVAGKPWVPSQASPGVAPQSTSGAQAGSVAAGGPGEISKPWVPSQSAPGTGVTGAPGPGVYTPGMVISHDDVRPGDTFGKPWVPSQSTPGASPQSAPGGSPSGATGGPGAPAPGGYPPASTSTNDWVARSQGASFGSDRGAGPGDGPEQRLPDGGGTTPDPTAPPPASSTPPPGGTPPPGTAPPPLGRGRPADPVTSHNDWLHSDSSGKPWGFDNLPPNPGGTEDPTAAARWYQQFNFLDQSLVNVSAADVQAFRTSGYNPTEQELASQPGMMRSPFLAWWQHGKPTPAQNPPPATTPSVPTNPSGWVDPSIGGPQQQHRTPPPGAAPTPPPPDGGTGAAPPPGDGPGGLTKPWVPPQATPEGGPPSTPGAPPPSSLDEITKLIDLFNSGKGPQQPPIEDMLNPMFAHQRQLLADQMRAEGAATGSIHSGGFGENLGSALSNLSGQQSSALASEKGQEYLAKLNQNTQLTTLATQAGMQKYTTDINADLEKYKVNTNDDLQRWLTDKNNTLAKYGIDSNDVLQRYLGKLGIDKANIDAKATVDAAALHAAAAQAAAAASSAAAQYGANVQLQLGQGNLQVTRENNMANFILGLMGLGQTGLGNLGNIFSNFPPGSFVVKP